MPDTIRIITRGDDCGGSHSANLGIMEATKAGLLKNISVMAPGLFVQEGAAMFAGKTEICFGLHMTLNSEWDKVKWGPVLPPERVPSLVDQDGHFFASPQVFRDNPPSVQEILIEFQAQLDKARALGFTISYVDAHMMFERYIDGLEEQLRAWAVHEGLLYHSDYYHALPKGEQKDDPVEEFISKLEATLPEQYLLVTHPTFDSSEVRTLGNKHESAEQIAATRTLDIQLLTDPRVVASYQRLHIVPLRYDQAEKVRDRFPAAEEYRK